MIASVSPMTSEWVIVVELAYMYQRQLHDDRR